MPPLALALLAGLTMVAFAGNSLLCRLALQQTGIDAISFTVIRLLSGSLMLTLLVGRRAGGGPGTRLRNGLRESFRMSSWAGALALFLYALCFSVAYLSTPAASGALLLFGAVQLSMSAWGWWQGERLWRRQIAGLLLALAGLIWLLLPGVSAPPLRGALLMVMAGLAWATYSLLGQSVATPLRSTCGNFLRAVPMALLAMALLHSVLHWDGAGALLALGSGAVASGLGYALWYRLLPKLKAIQAATLQLCVPVLAAVGAVVWLGEPLTLRTAMASTAVLGGIALVVTPSASKASARQLDSG